MSVRTTRKNLEHRDPQGVNQSQSGDEKPIKRGSKRRGFKETIDKVSDLKPKPAVATTEATGSSSSERKVKHLQLQIPRKGSDSEEDDKPPTVVDAVTKEPFLLTVPDSGGNSNKRPLHGSPKSSTPFPKTQPHFGVEEISSLTGAPTVLVQGPEDYNKSEVDSLKTPKSEGDPNEDLANEGLKDKDRAVRTDEEDAEVEGSQDDDDEKRSVEGSGEGEVAVDESEDEEEKNEIETTTSQVISTTTTKASGRAAACFGVAALTAAVAALAIGVGVVVNPENQFFPNTNPFLN